MSRIGNLEAAEICGIQPATLRRWVFDGRLKRYWDGFEFDDLIAARDGRDMNALMVRAGVPGDHATRLARPA